MLVKMYVETFIPDVIDFIGNVIMCVTSRCPIIFNIRVNSLILIIYIKLDKINVVKEFFFQITDNGINIITCKNFTCHLLIIT